jgi:hypothetical protein
MEWIYVLTVLTSSVAAVLAWVAKLMWSKEFKEAKEETIKSKDAQIELLKNEIQNLRELSPMKLREYFVSVKQQLEEYNDKLLRDLKDKDQRILTLRHGKQRRGTEIERLMKERAELNDKINALEKIVGDEFIGSLIRRSFFGFQLKLRGDKDKISAFMERAAKLGESKGCVSRPINDHYLVDLTYSSAVTRESINKLIGEIGLEAIEVKSMRGVNF